MGVVEENIQSQLLASMYVHTHTNSYAKAQHYMGEIRWDFQFNLTYIWEYVKSVETRKDTVLFREKEEKSVILGSSWGKSENMSSDI